ncbi:MAG: Site-specific recombinase, invertase Pin s [Eubacterium sp.]|nr:Site-specific recombinase, invertase Pin s [Eubacterium sp.]
MARKAMFDRKTSAIAVIYARYSSHSQKDVSIEQQVEECQAYADVNNMKVIAVYADRHLTGKTDKRPDFQRMMRHAEKKQFQVIISYKSNRMARNMLQALQYEEKLSKFEIRVVYAKEEFGDNAAGRFALRTMMNVNQFYSENMAEDVMRGMLDNAENCLITNGCLPLGYKKGDDGRYAIDEPAAEIVREIFTQVACGEPFMDIASDLNTRNIKTSKGNVWNKNSFHSILTNERYTGVYIYDEVRVDGGVPQIIDKELFFRVQEVLKMKKNPQGRHRINGDYLLTGKLYCGHCKSHIVGVSGTGKSGNLHHYYACMGKRLGKVCKKSPVRRDWIEQEVAKAIKQYIIRDDVLNWIADTVTEYGRKNKDNSQTSLLENQLAENKKATKNLLSAIEQGIVTETTKSRLLELEAEQSKIIGLLAIEKSEIPEIKREHIVAWLESFKDGDIEDKKFQSKLFDTFLTAVYIYDNDLRIVFNFTGKKNTIEIPLKAEIIDNIKISGTADSSYKFSYGSPKESHTNTAATIYMVSNVFVLVSPLIRK